MNPEFQRNLWLEASPRRIAWAGVALALIFGMVMLVTSKEGGMAQALSVTGLIVYVACAIFWGSRAAGGAVLAEIADRTWDFQRLSAISPWAMTWGKLFGSSSLAWLCGLTALVVGALASALGGGPPPGLMVVFLLALAVLLQAALLAAALVGVRKARAEGRVARSGGIVWGLIFGGFLLSSIAGTLGIKRGVGLLGAGRMFSPPEIVDWWGLQIQGEVFRAVGVAVFAAWALAGAWRLMRLELQMRSNPLVWPSFLIFLAIFSGGFFFGAGLGEALIAGGLSCVLCAYAAAFAEPADRVKLRQFFAALRDGATGRAGALTPMAIAPAVIAVVLMLAALPLVPAFTPDGNPFQIGPVHGLAVIAFMVRDLGVIAFFRFGPRPQRGDFGAVVALFLLYTMGVMIGGMADGDHGSAFFVPIPADPVVSLGSGLVQAAISWWLAARRIRAPERGASAPAS